VELPNCQWQQVLWHLMQITELLDEARDLIRISQASWQNHPQQETGVVQMYWYCLEMMLTLGRNPIDSALLVECCPNKGSSVTNPVVIELYLNKTPHCILLRYNYFFKEAGF
jgi:hypothetical protein